MTEENEVTYFVNPVPYDRDDDYSEADYEENYGILDDDYEDELHQQIEDYRETYPEKDSLDEVIERERQEDALDAEQNIIEGEMRDEYYDEFNN